MVWIVSHGPSNFLTQSNTLKKIGHVKRSTLGLSKLYFEGMVQGKGVEKGHLSHVSSQSANSGNI